VNAFHLMIEHFPIALLVVSVFLEAAGRIWHKDDLRMAAEWNWRLGVAGAAAAVLTGLWAVGHTRISNAAKDIVEIHQTIAWVVLIGGSAVLAWNKWGKPKWQKRFDLYVLAFRFLVVAILILGANLGGRMIFEFGVGTPPAPALQAGYYGRGRVRRQRTSTSRPRASNKPIRRGQNRAQVD
jgi:uncharacterized membrane protein